MSNKDQVANLLVSGEQWLTEMINRQNGTTFTPSELIIGRPVRSADEVYNTDVEVTFPAVPVAGDADPEPPTGELHYHRFDLGKLFAEKNIRIRDRGYANHRDLTDHILEEAKIQFDLQDLQDVEIPQDGKYPKTLLLRADPISLRFVGQFSIDLLAPVEDDASFLTDPEVAVNQTLTGPGVKSDGTLFHGTGNPAGGMIVATNGEIQIASAARLYRNTTVFQPTAEGVYHLNISDQTDWSIPHSFVLLDERNSERLTDLYSCQMKITVLETGGVLNFSLQRQYGQLAFVDQANGLRIQDPGTYNEKQSLYQDIQRVSFYKGKLGSPTLNAQGAPYGRFRVELLAERLEGDVPPVELSYEVEVAGLPAE